jgi:hypothetical protein
MPVEALVGYLKCQNKSTDHCSTKTNEYEKHRLQISKAIAFYLEDNTCKVENVYALRGAITEKIQLKKKKKHGKKH